MLSDRFQQWEMSDTSRIGITVSAPQLSLMDHSTNFYDAFFKSPHVALMTHIYSMKTWFKADFPDIQCQRCGRAAAFVMVPEFPSYFKWFFISLCTLPGQVDTLAVTDMERNGKTVYEDEPRTVLSRGL